MTPGESLIGGHRPIERRHAARAPANASRVCIIDETLARHLFAGANPVGRHLSYEDSYTAEKALEIVGVVKDAHYGSVRESDREGMIYETSWSNGAEVRWLVVRFGGKCGPGNRRHPPGTARHGPECARDARPHDGGVPQRRYGT